MMANCKYKENQYIGTWKLIQNLGAGGSGEVWKATDSRGEYVAIKILKSWKSSYTYERFKSEVEFLQSLGVQRGVLPLLDSSLPEQPSRENPPWLVMPIATSIKEALGKDSELESVVEAVATIAETLATLAQKGISHRDIKPDNLYSYNSEWVIGDFGLVDFPGKEPITEAGKKLGPLYFLAPEMLSHPETADGKLADVYSLAKTLYVLATGQEYPPQGNQRVECLLETISNYIAHSRVHLLDRLVERATMTDPNARPTMADFASELRAWLTPPKALTSPEDISDLAAQLAERYNFKMECDQRADETRKRQIEQARQAFETLVEGTNKIFDKLKQSGLSGGQVTIYKDSDCLRPYDGTWYGLPSFLEKWINDPQAESEWYDYISTRLLAGSDGFGKESLILYGGAFAYIIPGGQLCIKVGHILVEKGQFKEEFWSDSRIVPIGSALQDKAIHELLGELQASLRGAVEGFGSLIKQE